MVNLLSSQALAVVCLAGVVFAHGGDDEHHAREHAKRSGFFDHSRRALEKCSEHIKASGLEQRNIARRSALAKQHSRRAIEGRDYGKYLNESHKADAPYNLTTPVETLFGTQPSCVLWPYITEGPYFVSGEVIRSDTKETQEGVDLYTDIQLIDIDTCEPLEGVYIDFWHANSTGVYSGIVASGNGNDNDTENINKTFLRGLQSTTEDGSAQFKSIFPGHYTDRAIHIHIVVHQNATLLANNTLSGGTVSYVGQFGYDQDLISEVSETYPYTTNEQVLTLNSADPLLLLEGEEGFDPFAEYVLLGDDISDGILSWISFAVNTSATYGLYDAAHYGAGGGTASNTTVPTSVYIVPVASYTVN